MLFLGALVVLSRNVCWCCEVLVFCCAVLFRVVFYCCF